MDEGWVGSKRDGDIGRSEDHLWELGKVKARHVQQSVGRYGTPHKKGRGRPTTVFPRRR